MNKAKRVKLVQVARKALALDDEAYRAILRDYGGVDSAKALDEHRFAKVMDLPSERSRRHGVGRTDYVDPRVMGKAVARWHRSCTEQMDQPIWR